MKYPAGAAIARLNFGGHVALKDAIVEITDFDDAVLPWGKDDESTPIGYLTFRVIDSADCVDLTWALKCALKTGMVGGHQPILGLDPLTPLAKDMITVARRRANRATRAEIKDRVAAEVASLVSR